jgi:hypothetical protein
VGRDLPPDAVVVVDRIQNPVVPVMGADVIHFVGAVLGATDGATKGKQKTHGSLRFILG